MNDIKQIIHIDMDAFYASIEQRDNPKLRGKPIMVGGSPQGRGVVLTCSYEARKYGIHSAMPARKAVYHCPDGIFVPPRFDVYKEASEQIMDIFYAFTDKVQPMSLDEAYLDITNISLDFKSSEWITREILNKIKQKTFLTASAGVSFNKFLAKVASDFNKPHGITVVTIEDADEFIDNLPMGKFFGVGKVTEKRMLDLGIKTGADLKAYGLGNLKKHLGNAGIHFYNCAIGIDNRDVHTNWSRRSLGKERTLRSDIDDKDEMIEILENIAHKIEDHLKNKQLKGRTITLRMRYKNFQRISRSISLMEPTNDYEIIIENIKRLLERTEAGDRKVRLLGIAISNFFNKENGMKYDQLTLD